jgi:hypothetical protein
MLKPSNPRSKANTACENFCPRVGDHFVAVNKMVALGSAPQARALEQTIAVNVAEILST